MHRFDVDERFVNSFVLSFRSLGLESLPLGILIACNFHRTSKSTQRLATIKSNFSTFIPVVSYQSAGYRLLTSAEDTKNCYSIVDSGIGSGHLNGTTFNGIHFNGSTGPTSDGPKFPNLNSATKSPAIKSEILIKSEKASIPRSSVQNGTYASESAMINKPNLIASSGQLTSACITSHSMNKYVSAFDAAPTVSIDDSYSRSYAQQMCDLQHPYASGTSGYELARSYENAVNGMTFDRYDFNSLISTQRPAMYPYLQSSIDDLSGQQQKYFQEHHQMATEAMLKSEHGADGSQTPLYPRPMYHHYDQFGAATAAPPPGFSAINLTVKMASAFKPNGPMGGPVPMMNIPTSNPSHAYNSAHFPVQRMSESSPSSPRIGTSPNVNCSPTPTSNVAPNGSPSYPNPPHQSQSFSSTRSPQSEPVDFSAPLRPLPVGACYPFNGTPISQPVYSRESTPDSAASPYIDSFRNDVCGKCPSEAMAAFCITILVHCSRQQSASQLQRLGRPI